jgi:hypothetical protein
MAILFQSAKSINIPKLACLSSSTNKHVALNQLVRLCTRLERIRIDNADDSKSTGLLQLIENNMRNLRYLSCDNYSQVAKCDFSDASKLKHLAFKNCYIHSVSMRLNHVTTLKHVSLAGSQYQGMFFRVSLRVSLMLINTILVFLLIFSYDIFHYIILLVVVVVNAG